MLACGAKIQEGAGVACGVTSGAGLASVFDEKVGPAFPVALGEQIDEFLFGFLWVRGRGEVKAFADAFDVRVHDDAFVLVKPVV